MPRQDISLAGHVVAVTGGARGIGRATAAALVAEGARVAIGDLDAELAARTAAELGGGTISSPLDVTDRDGFAAFLDTAERELGPLHGLVNNAGIMPIASQLDEDDATARRTLDINVHGVIFGTKLALARMQPRGDGHVVNVASQAGKAAFGGLATYCASKFAVVGYTASVADELRGTGVHASCVLPALVRTELSAGLPSPRLIKPVEPEDVATAVVATLRRPKQVVHVPRSGGVILGISNALPPAARAALERALGIEHAAINADRAARREYEERASREIAGVGSTTATGGSPSSQI